MPIGEGAIGWWMVNTAGGTVDFGLDLDKSWLGIPVLVVSRQAG